MFHRSLGMVSPLEVESKLFNLSYIECGDDYIQQVLEERIGEACKKVASLEKQVWREGEKEGQTYMSCLYPSAWSSFSAVVCILKKNE